jgi:hypothetical protein
VVKEGDEHLFENLLSSRSLLSEHGRQNKQNLMAVLAQKPFWTMGSECYSLAKLTDDENEDLADHDVSE